MYYYLNVFYWVFDLYPYIHKHLDLCYSSAHEISTAAVHRRIHTTGSCSQAGQQLQLQPPLEASRLADLQLLPLLEANRSADLQLLPPLEASRSADLQLLPPLEASRSADLQLLPPF